MIRLATRLGIMACRYLVNGYNENRYISAPEIAKHYNVNVRAVMPSLRQLTRVGILRSRVGGNTPGFIFSNNPNELTLYKILVALEGDTIFECCKNLIPNLACDCGDISKCGIFMLFHAEIANSSNLLSSTTIAEHALKRSITVVNF